MRRSRTEQAAAAEDFDPLRIRPYVELDGSRGRSGAVPPAGGAAARPPAPADPEATMALRALGTEPPAAHPAGTATGADGTDAASASVLPTPLAPATGSPSAHDLRLFETGATRAVRLPSGPGDGGDGTGSGGTGTDEPKRRRRRALALGAAGAVAVVLGAAGYAGGLFSYESPSRNGALPDEIRASVPDGPAGSASASPSPSATTAPPPAAPAPSASASASPSPSASTSSSADPTESASPTATPSGGRSSEPAATSSPDPGTGFEGDPGDRPGGGQGLRLGDRGPEVLELQQRLTQLFLYVGPTDGTYSDELENSVRTYQWARGTGSDGLGVYGAATRAMLESETHEP
ncbi:peptidoglycan-binding protein [Streptomyces sp. SHP 1-2]|nr:peptidoglycan-binding protein [Streptomyces sp. SHP 1-2]